MWQEPAALRDFGPTYVADGSGADITHLLSDVRCTPQSGQTADMLACPLSATSGQSAAQQIGIHSITSSAVIRMTNGTGRPSDLAVLRLMNSSYFVTCWAARCIWEMGGGEHAHRHKVQATLAQLNEERCSSSAKRSPVSS